MSTTLEFTQNYPFSEWLFVLNPLVDLQSRAQDTTTLARDIGAQEL
jgi:hypothetical protein